MLVSFVTSFTLYVYSEKLIDRANEQQLLSYKLAGQLRQSSDDLTRMVRTYVVTGDPAYKQSYQDILDIRDGIRLTPDGYDGVYWDLALLDPHYTRPAKGQGVALLDRMRDAGFSDEEFRKLAEAKANSDELTNREYEAMELLETPAEDSQSNRMRAIAMLHDATYHHAKAAIMRPINDFYTLMQDRTEVTVRRAESFALICRLAFLAFTLTVVGFLWRLSAESRAILGGSAQEVHARITRIGQGDFTVSGSAASDSSVLAGLDRMAAKLSAMEAERARTLAEMADKNEALARSNADLEQFAYVASHDLQTPLRNIVSYTQLLERRYKTRLDSDADDFIGFIVDNTKRMTRLIHDLLDYSRASRQADPLEPTDARAAVAEALDNLRPDLDRFGVVVQVAELPRVMATSSHLTSLFQNLLGNAIKYRSPDRATRISIAAERIAPETWRFAVTDNGIGIERQYHEKIFEIFQRLHPTADAEGTGIGLTLCRRIVHRFGGSIWVESEPGQGTSILFTLRTA
ncbi:sensor histidine kinase [Paramagnetospirillum marisnigri]|nr:ATP-binding protein [Paramagnetospirillum marisnigri]